MTGSELLALANTIRKISKEIKSTGATPTSGLDHPQKKELIEALREIYFTPNGVLGLLRTIANGETPNPEEVACVLPQFNDFEYHGRRFIDLLEFGLLGRRSELSIRERRTLDMIRWNKINVRRNIQKVLNEALTPSRRQRISVKRAEELVALIENLNSSIEDIEEALLHT